MQAVATRTRASARRPGSLDVLDVLLGRVGVVEAQVAACRRTRARRRSSGRSTWRGRCAGSRWARAETGSPLVPRVFPAARSSATIVRMKSRPALGSRRLGRRVGHGGKLYYKARAPGSSGACLRHEDPIRHAPHTDCRSSQHIDVASALALRSSAVHARRRRRAAAGRRLAAVPRHRRGRGRRRLHAADRRGTSPTARTSSGRRRPRPRACRARSSGATSSSSPPRSAARRTPG